MFLVTFVFYATAAVTLVQYSLKKRRKRTLPKTREEVTIDSILWAWDVINFINASIATVASSIVLLETNQGELFDCSVTSSTPLGTYTIETVIGYIVAELLLTIFTWYYCNVHFWTRVWDWYSDMILFHVVALVGLSSVLLFGFGYSIAIWTIWTELTSVFIGLEALCLKAGSYMSKVCSWMTNFLFVSQRGVLFTYLAIQCLLQCRYDSIVILQTLLMLTGAILNIRFIYSIFYD